MVLSSELGTEVFNAESVWELYPPVIQQAKVQVGLVVDARKVVAGKIALKCWKTSVKSFLDFLKQQLMIKSQSQASKM